MNRAPDVSRRLGVGARQRVRGQARGLQRRLRIPLWFPHLPLFLLVGSLGLLQLNHALGVGIVEGVTGQDLLRMSTGAATAVVHGAPSATAGVFLVAMAFGLLTRSRLAWVVAVLATTVSMMLIGLVWKGGRAAHGELLGFNAFILVSLLVAGRAFSRSSLATATLFAVASIILLVAYAVLGTYLLGDQFSPPIGDLITAFYFAVVTMSTVGYGDILPKSPEARLFAVSVIILGITVFATSISALLVPLVNRRMEHLLVAKERKVPRSSHYVIVSDSSLARNTAKELVARNQPVTFLLPRVPETNEEHYDIVVGDPSDLAVLRRADAHDAKALLALGNDDSENAFVVMAAKELSDKLRTVAVVNDARNMARVKRVRPDLIIAPQVLGGELLAMALSGETVNSEKLLQQLLHFTS